ncbi:MAG TPA: hypothetical protein PKA21_14695 [Kiritimatiellia bacterium]|nr:hypothetical protein [Kiritimatiellia bacterium]
MSTPIILRDFSFFRDFRQIQWGATLWYNLLRSACAGLVLGILMFIFPEAAGDRTSALTTPFIWPIAYVILFLPMGIIFSLLRNLPFVGLIAAFFALIAVAIGDPIVCILHKIFPKIVPVESPPLFSLYIVFWVLNAPEVSVAG